MNENNFTNSLEQLIKNRRTIHSYTSEAVPLSVIEKSVELMAFAPNHKNTQPWRIYRLSKEARQKIGEIAIEIKSQKSDINDVEKKMTADKFLEGGELLVVATTKSMDNFRQKEDYASLACGLQNSSLYLQAMGYGSKWSTGAVTKDKKIFQIIGASENEIELEGFFWIGRAQQVPLMMPKAKLNQIFKDIK